MDSAKIFSNFNGIDDKISIMSLINRIQPGYRTKWSDIYKGAGIYIVYHIAPKDIRFKNNAEVSNSILIQSKILEEKWERINKIKKTDIIYIGKGNVRGRIRSLIRFGLGMASNHKGGEWLWQINDYSKLNIMISPCPVGKQVAYEKYVLDLFHSEHGDWPLANREGGKGPDTWCPNELCSYEKM